VFAAFFATAVVKRRESQSHKRWMLLASISVLTAAIARWPGVLEYGPLAFFAVTDLFIVALAAWDLKSRGRLHPATLVGGLVLIASQPLRLALAGTPAWLAFAAWATALVA
jgi:dolichyl-phosphate-mannose--protein O-mannosyl transferase